jgi:TolB-like protein
LSNYFDELKRRNVFRVAAAYAVVGWLTIEVIDTLVPRMGMPEWVAGFVILLVLIGFPIALLFSWAFEMTPEGIKKTADVEVDESITTTTGQKINYIIIAALAAFIFVQQFSPSLSKISPFSEDAPGAAAIGIAVLPFADLSQDGDQEYLGDGVAEEILNVLAGVEGLKVTSRTSAFAFKGQSHAIPEIAEILGVSHVVEGSIRKQNDKVRITAQLIDVSDDSHLWSDTYDSDLSDIFRLQDEIAAQISSALSDNLSLSLPSSARETPNWNVGAYELYLQGRQNVIARINFDEAIELLDAALMLEPEFADAWAEKATALTLKAYNIGLDEKRAAESFAFLDESWLAARRATEIEANNPLALAVQGLILINRNRWIEARVYLERAVQSDSPDDNAFLWLAILEILAGDSDSGLATIDAGLKLSPTAPNLIRWRGRVLSLNGKWQQVWDEKDRPVAVDMEPTLWDRQVAGLQLGLLSLDEVVAWLKENGTDETGDQAPIIATLNSLFGDKQAVSLQQLEEMSQAADATTQYSMMALQPGLIPSYFELRLTSMADMPSRIDQEFLWKPGAAPIWDKPEFLQLVRDLNLPQYWDLHGWPDVCRPTSVDEFECG